MEYISTPHHVRASAVAASLQRRATNQGSISSSSFIPLSLFFFPPTTTFALTLQILTPFEERSLRSLSVSASSRPPLEAGRKAKAANCSSWDGQTELLSKNRGRKEMGGSGGRAINQACRFEFFLFGAKKYHKEASKQKKVQHWRLC